MQENTPSNQLVELLIRRELGISRTPTPEAIAMAVAGKWVRRTIQIIHEDGLMLSAARQAGPVMAVA